MKKVFAFLLVLVMAFSFAACGEGEDDSGGGSGEGSGGGKGNSYKDAVELYVDAMYRGDKAHIESLAPNAFWTKMESGGGSKDYILEELKYVSGAYNENYKNQFGDDYTVTVAITETKVDGDKLGKLAAAFAEQKGINKDKVTAAYDVVVKITFNGTEPGEDQLDMGVVQIDGTWYCAEWMSYDDVFAVSFALESMLGG